MKLMESKPVWVDSPTGGPIGTRPRSTGPARDFAKRNRRENPRLPVISRPLVRLFTWYSRGYLRKHFHTLRVSRAGFPEILEGWPLVVYSNHASWWDPLVGLILRERFFPNRDTFAPMESTMLRRYGFFRRLGFFGVEQQTRRGAVQFLRTSQAVLDSPNTLLAITPQGRFVDVRERPLRFGSGLGHLAVRLPRACFMPVAIEYVFWEERLPEILVRFGRKTQVCGNALSSTPAAQWTATFEKALQDTQEALAVQAQRRCSLDFVELLRGGAGQGGMYDLWCSLKARFQGRRFEKEHASK